MKTSIFLAGLIALLWCAPAQAIVGKIPRKADDNARPEAPPAFACTPADFTLVKDDTGFHFSGALTVPTTGYAYTIAEEEPGPDGSLHGTLTLAPPQGAAGQVVSKLAINYVFKGDGDQLTLNVVGLPPGSVKAIECKMAGTDQ